MSSKCLDTLHLGLQEVLRTTNAVVVVESADNEKPSPTCWSHQIPTLWPVSHATVQKILNYLWPPLMSLSLASSPTYQAPELMMTPILSSYDAFTLLDDCSHSIVHDRCVLARDDHNMHSTIPYHFTPCSYFPHINFLSCINGGVPPCTATPSPPCYRSWRQYLWQGLGSSMGNFNGDMGQGSTKATKHVSCGSENHETRESISMQILCWSALCTCM